ncbi:hypothetical protein ACOME3_005879 [Neoechinorhynchus agilis]
MPSNLTSKSLNNKILIGSLSPDLYIQPYIYYQAPSGSGLKLDCPLKSSETECHWFVDNKCTLDALPNPHRPPVRPLKLIEFESKLFPALNSAWTNIKALLTGLLYDTEHSSSSFIGHHCHYSSSAPLQPDAVADTDLIVNGDFVYFKRASAHHSGLYSCHCESIVDNEDEAITEITVDGKCVRSQELNSELSLAVEATRHKESSQ